ncbi:MAG: aldose epimerase family protein [Planctomycetota bacterium]
MITRHDFGATAAGDAVSSFTLENAAGTTARVMSLGATLTHLETPDRNGGLADVVLGFDTVAEYESSKNSHFGCTTGRVANRIAGGRFTVDGVEYQIACKYGGPNAIHGGVERTIDKFVWDAEPAGDRVVFRHTSPDGEENFPGELQIETSYRLTDANELVIAYRVTTDKPTPVNLTNHSYFNLRGAGEPSTADHVLTINADRYTPTGETQVPTGELAPVEGTPLDFRQPMAIGARVDELAGTPENGYDHNFVINQQPPSGEPPLAAELHDPVSGRVMTVRTTQPGVQFYDAGGLKGQAGKGGKTYPPRSACCLETQHFPDSINQPNFPSILLRPGEVYEHACVYAFSAR